MKRYSYLFIFVFIMISCGESKTTDQQQSRSERLRLQREDSLALKISVLPTLDCMPLYMAQEYGLFDSLGVDVRLKIRKTQMECDQDMLQGRTEGAVTDLVRGEWLKSRGVDMRYVGTTIASWQLFASPSARIKQVKQLGDKMVAVTRHSATDYLTWRMLDGVTTSADVFRVQVNDIPLRLEMLMNSEIDVAWLPEPFATKARMIGLSPMVGSDQYASEMGVLAFRQKSVSDKRRQEQLKALCKAWNQACDSLNKFGAAAYSFYVAKFCSVKKEEADSLPSIVFIHTGVPREEKIELARKFVEQFPDGYTLND